MNEIAMIINNQNKISETDETKGDCWEGTVIWWQLINFILKQLITSGQHGVRTSPPGGKHPPLKRYSSGPRSVSAPAP